MYFSVFIDFMDLAKFWVSVTSSSPIFYVLICSEHHQIWQVYSLVHNSEVFFLFFQRSFLFPVLLTPCFMIHISFILRVFHTKFERILNGPDILLVMASAVFIVLYVHPVRHC